MHLKIAILIFPVSLFIISHSHLFNTIMSIIKNEIGKIKIAIFKCTVLEDYWELEARTGTRMKLCFSTFTSFRWFSNTKTLLFVILKTMSGLLRKNKHFQLAMNWSRVKMLKNVENYRPKSKSPDTFFVIHSETTTLAVTPILEWFFIIWEYKKNHLT